MKFSLLTIVGLSATISCFMISAHTAPIPRKRKVEKKFQGSANVLATPSNPDSSDCGRHHCGGDETGGSANDQPELINLDSSGTKTEGQKCFAGVAGGLCVDGLYCYYLGTTTVNENSGGAFCCPEGNAPNNDSTCGQRGPPGPGPDPGPDPGPGLGPDLGPGPDPGPGPDGVWKQESALGMTYDASAYVLASSCTKICGGFSGDACWMDEWQGAASTACTDFCAKALNGGSYPITGYDGETVEVTNLAVGHCIGDSLGNSCGDSCGKTYVVYNKDSGSGGAASYAIIMGIDGAAIPSFEMSKTVYEIFRGTTQSGNRVKPTYYNVAEGPYVMPNPPPHVQ